MIFVHKDKFKAAVDSAYELVKDAKKLFPSGVKLPILGVEVSMPALTPDKQQDHPNSVIISMHRTYTDIEVVDECDTNDSLHWYEVNRRDKKKLQKDEVSKIGDITFQFLNCDYSVEDEDGPTPFTLAVGGLAKSDYVEDIKLRAGGKTDTYDLEKLLFESVEDVSSYFYTIYNRDSVLFGAILESKYHIMKFDNNDTLDIQFKDGKMIYSTCVNGLISDEFTIDATHDNLEAVMNAFIGDSKNQEQSDNVGDTPKEEK